MEVQMDNSMLKKKTIDELVYNSDGAGRCVKKLTVDEIAFLTKNKHMYSWKHLRSEINQHRHMNCGMSLNHMIAQCHKLGIYNVIDDKEQKQESKNTVKKTKKESDFFDPSELKKYYNH